MNFIWRGIQVSIFSRELIKNYYTQKDLIYLIQFHIYIKSITTYPKPKSQNFHIKFKLILIPLLEKLYSISCFLCLNHLSCSTISFSVFSYQISMLTITLISSEIILYWPIINGASISFGLFQIDAFRKRGISAEVTTLKHNIRFQSLCKFLIISVVFSRITLSSYTLSRFECPLLGTLLNCNLSEEFLLSFRDSLNKTFKLFDWNFLCWFWKGISSFLHFKGVLNRFLSSFKPSILHLLDLIVVGLIVLCLID